jgi:hypothetical protein
VKFLDSDPLCLSSSLALHFLLFSSCPELASPCMRNSLCLLSCMPALSKRTFFCYWSNSTLNFMTIYWYLCTLKTYRNVLLLAATKQNKKCQHNIESMY